eukprot:c18901_g1_i2 orf=349-1677(+)
MLSPDTTLVWEELNVATPQPVRTAALSAHGPSFHLSWEKRLSFPLWTKVKAAFLPQGYPGSVTSDYMAFQFWDTLQALSTYVRSMLSTQALLGGIGVGETTATVIGATFQWFLRDFTGMLGGILFTLYQGSNLDSKAKQWRLIADFMNDIGMLMDLISPLFPRAFVTLLCVGSISRSVTGVASGATRAALTQHFALQQNAADISAKEGSQETAATMVGMLLGMFLANFTAGHSQAIWFSFLVLTGFHIYANYKAVLCLCLTSLNAERMAILLEAFIATGTVLTPKEVSMREQLLPQIRLGNLLSQRSKTEPNLRIVFGTRISSLKIDSGWKAFHTLVHRYRKANYLLFVQGGRVEVILHKHAIAKDFLQSYVHALVLAIFLDLPLLVDGEIQSISWMDTSYAPFLSKLKLCGWNVDRILVNPGLWRADWSTNHIDMEGKSAS